MVTILLETIIKLLTGWQDSFFTWANEVGDKIAAIKTNSDSLPDIKSNTDDIKDNTAAVITPISNINTNVSAIAPDVATIKTDTAVIKNNANSIMISSGQTAAYAEDIADNTLDCKNRLVTIGSDTTQIRADSGSLAADVSEIKNTLGLYLYNTIVTEDAEGPIANFDTDLKDYLQNAVVTIPADANGISGLSITKCGLNLFPDSSVSGIASAVVNCFLRAGTYRLSALVTSSDTDKTTSGIMAQFTDDTYDFVREIPRNVRSSIVFNPSKDVKKILFFASTNYAQSVGDAFSYNNVQIEYGSNATTFKSYEHNDYSVTFTSPITDGAEADLLTGIVKINTSPVTYDSITPLTIRTYKGVNNVYSDIGDMSVTYRETLKHYLEKQEGN